MTDREFLELSAKAAGFEINNEYENPYYPERCKPDAEFPSLLILNRGIWSPLTDDGDALRLAAKIGIFDKPFAFWPSGIIEFSNSDEFRDEIICTRVRRAIVRAAASIGAAL